MVDLYGRCPDDRTMHRSPQPPVSRRGLLIGAGSMLAVSGTPGRAQAPAYPTRTIRIVVGFPAGGPTDAPARIIAEKLRAALGQPVIVENKPGASGMIAVNDVLAQPRDGHTLLLCTYSDSYNPSLFRSATYKVENLEPIAQVTKAYYAFAVRNDMPVTTWPEFVAFAKSRPGQLTYGHVGVGSAPDYIAKQVERDAGLKMQAVPFRGSGPALQEMIASRLDFMVGPLAVTIPLYKARHIKVIGVTSPERLAVVPEVPTLTEQGMPFVSSAWLGVCAAAGTPQPIADDLNKAVNDAMKSEDYRSLMARTGLEAADTTREEFRKVMLDTARETGGLIRDLGISLD